MNLKPTLSVLLKVTMTDAMIISSTVAEDEHPVWTAGATFGLDAYCLSPLTHRVYRSMKADNIGKDPTDTSNQTGVTVWWQDVGPTNKHAMFDDENNTQTVAASPLTVVLRPGFFNALNLDGIDAEHLTITVKDAPGGNVVASYDADLEGSAPGDWYEHFHDRFKPQRDFLMSDIDQYHNAEITMTLTSSSGTVKLGVFEVGDLRPLGATQHGAKAKPKSYSYIKTDEFGKSTIKRRHKAKDMTLTAWIDLSEANAVHDLLTEVIDVPCLWVGNNLPEYGGLRVRGLGNGEISYDYPKACLLTVDVQGFI